MNHLRASTFELPVPAAERFGLDETPMLLDVLQEDGWIRRADDDRFYWSHENFPASDFSLRTGAPENVVIIDTTGDRHRVLGEVDLFAAPLLVHEKAIYIHQGVQHHVDRLDWEERKAYVTQTDVDYYTDADLGITLKVLEVFDEADPPPAGLRQRGEVMVAWKVTMFKKLKYHTHENVGWGSISLPEQEMHTTATWLVPPAELVNRYDRDTLDGALIGLARVARTTARPAADVRPARPRRPRPGAGARSPAGRRSTSTTRCPAASASPSASSPWSTSCVRACREAVLTCPAPTAAPRASGPPSRSATRGKRRRRRAADRDVLTDARASARSPIDSPRSARRSAPGRTAPASGTGRPRRHPGALVRRPHRHRGGRHRARRRAARPDRPRRVAAALRDAAGRRRTSTPRPPGCRPARAR